MKVIYYVLLLTSMSVFSQNIIIGDSQVPYIDTQTHKAERAPGLWKGGIGAAELTKMVNNYPITPSIKNVVISIGTNDRFQGNVVQLFLALKRKFPNAKFYAVQGSWGWGGVKSISRTTVYRYYLQKFRTQGAEVIEVPIGYGDPHSQKASYNLIGKSLDKIL